METNNQITFLCGPHGSGKYATAIKLATGTDVSICTNWDGTINDIGDVCHAFTKTLIIHGVYLPEHYENLKLLIESRSYHCYRNGKNFRINRPNLIICTTAKEIPNDLITPNTIIFTAPFKK